MSASNGPALASDLFIGDTTRKAGCIKGVKGLYPDLCFTYKPALPERIRAFGRVPTEKTDKAVIDLIVEHVLAWDVIDGQAEVPVNAGRVRTLYFEQQQKLIDHIFGYVFSGDAERDEKN